MYQMILVDDEPWALIGLEEIIPWEEYGFQICGRCSSGEQALREIAEKKPDAVCTDIRMPKFNGIEMLSQVREHLGQDVEFIIVSAYSDFEVARKAINYGAVGYVLKPLGADEVAKTVLRLKERLDQKHAVRLLRLDPENRESLNSAIAQLTERHLPGQTCFVRFSETESACPAGWNAFPLEIVGFPGAAWFLSTQEQRAPEAAIGWSLPHSSAAELGKMIREASASFYGKFFYASHPTVASLQAYLGENYKLSLSLGQLASKFFLSENYLCELFKKHTGDTILSFLKKLRLENACRLLSTSSLSIKEVAARVGFSDYSYFGRIFRKNIGQTPDQYRNTFSKDQVGNGG